MFSKQVYLKLNIPLSSCNNINIFIDLFPKQKQQAPVWYISSYLLYWTWFLSFILSMNLIYIMTFMHPLSKLDMQGFSNFCKSQKRKSRSINTCFSYLFFFFSLILFLISTVCPTKGRKRIMANDNMGVLFPFSFSFLMISDIFFLIIKDYMFCCPESTVSR